MKKKIIVLGSNGMAGHIIRDYLKSVEKYNVTGLVKSDFDAYEIMNGFAYDTLEFYMPDIVINCIGMINKYANDTQRKKEAILVNSFFPHELNDICSDIGAKLIHLSTDCIYSGDLTTDSIGENRMIRSYSKGDNADARDIYGKTKFLGEVTNKEALTLRQSIIGPELKNGISLFHWFLTLPKDSVINGFSKHYWNGITTLQLAKDIDQHIEEEKTGLFVNSNTWYISKYDLLKEMQKTFNRIDLTINEDDGGKKNMVIASDRGYNILEYVGMLDELKQYMIENVSRYSQYKECLQ